MEAWGGGVVIETFATASSDLAKHGQEELAGGLPQVGSYLVSLLAAGDRAGEGLLLPSVHAHGAEDGLGADGTLRGPRLVAV